MSARVYTFAWGNNVRRAELKGRVCVVEARGRMSTVLVRFLDTGERVTTSRRALRASDRGLVGAQPEALKDFRGSALRQRAPETREGQS